ncbi:MAG: DUF3422 family protein [Pseudomonadota bacterium]
MGFITRIRRQLSAYFHGTGSVDILGVGEPDADGIHFSDWRGGFYPERRRALNEAHARTAYPIRPYARISMLSRRFTSQEEIFQHRLMRAEDAARHARICQELENGDDETRKAAELEWLEWTESLINALRPNFIAAANPARANLFSQMMAESVRDWTQLNHRKSAETQLDRLEALYREPTSPLFVDQAARDAYLGADSAASDPKLMKPYHTAGSPKYRWFNFWKLAGEVASGRQLRLNVERFGLNQTFVAVEDFDKRPAPANFPGEGWTRHVERFFRLRSQAKPSAGADGEGETELDFRINREWTAIDTLDRELKSLSGHMSEPFQWYGSLATAAHIWVIPASEALRNLDDQRAHDLIESLTHLLRDAERSIDSGRAPLEQESAERLATAEREFIEGIASYAADFFGYPDFTRKGEARKDFVLSRVVGGRGILVSDLRGYSRDKDTRREKAIRAIIIDIRLTDEQRGRAVKRVTDIIAANTLGTRGFLYVDAINGVLNDIGVGLSYCYGRLLDIANKPPDAFKGKSIWDPAVEDTGLSDDAEYEDKLRRELRVNLLRLRQLSTHLSALNHFITYGVSGSALASRDFRKLIDERIMALRESRVSDYQTLEEFMRRFQQSTSTIDRTAERYDVLRRRLAEASQLFRAEAQGLELADIQKQSAHQTQIMRKADLLSTVIIGFGLVTTIDVVWPNLNWSVWLGLLILLVAIAAPIGISALFRAR